MGPIHGIEHGIIHLFEYAREYAEKKYEQEKNNELKRQEYDRQLEFYREYSDCIIPGDNFILITNIERYNLKMR